MNRGGLLETVFSSLEAQVGQQREHSYILIYAIIFYQRMENMIKRSSSTSFRELANTPTNLEGLAPLIDDQDLVLKSGELPWIDIQEKVVNKSEIALENKQNNCKSCQTHPDNESSDSSSRGVTFGRKRSIFVNFQKHLIITLKNNIRVVHNYRNDPTIYLANKMWQIFDKSRHYSKKILFFLFGVSHDCKPLKSEDIYPQFKQLSTIYPPQEIAMAQQYLREEVLRQSSKILTNNLLDFRRIKHKQQFRAYFENFLEELEQGWVSRRLPKSRKKGMGDFQISP